jgi:hypothetical protein
VEWLDSVDPASVEGVARFLSEMRRNLSVVQLEANAGVSRFEVAR